MHNHHECKTCKRLFLPSSMANIIFCKYCGIKNTIKLMRETDLNDVIKRIKKKYYSNSKSDNKNDTGSTSK